MRPTYGVSRLTSLDLTGPGTRTVRRQILEGVSLPYDPADEMDAVERWEVVTPTKELLQVTTRKITIHIEPTEHLLDWVDLPIPIAI
jgi:hypothetical protein